MPPLEEIARALSDYERQQIERIASWKGEVPGWASRTLALDRWAVGRVGAGIIPDTALSKSLAARAAAFRAAAFRTAGLDLLTSFAADPFAP